MTTFPRTGANVRRRCLSLAATLGLVALLPSSALATAPVVAPLGRYITAGQSPARIAVGPAGSVFVSDPASGSVETFDAFGRPVARREGFARPLGIAVKAQADLALAEEQPGRVSVFDAQWNVLYLLGQGDGEFQLPNHLAWDAAPGSNTLYVADSKANLIKVYAGPNLIRTFGGAGTGNGQFDFPAGLCIRTNGEVCVVDQNNDRVQVFDRAGTFLRSFGLGSSKPSGRSQAVLADAAGRVLVADSFQGTVKVFDADTGALLANIGSFGQQPGQLDAPAGLALDSLNRLFITSANARRLEVFGLDSFVHLALQPATGVVATDTSLVFTALAGGGGPFAWQWRKDGAAIAGATNATLAISAAQPANAGGYSVVITSAAGAFTSSIAPVTVLSPPHITSEPASLTVLRGSNALFTVGATGSALSYQWQFNGQDLNGATDAALLLPDIQLPAAGLYSVSVSNAVGISLSAAATLTVLPTPTILEIVEAAADTNRVLHLTVNTDPGTSFAVEASTNFADWQVLTNLAEEAGLVEFTDEASAGFWHRFYRLRWLP